MLTFRRAFLAAAALAVAAFHPAAAQQPTLQKLSSESVIEQIKARGTLRVGLDTFVPWAMPSKDGKLIGFEVDVATKLAADMGVKLELVPTAWDGIIPALVSGKFDFIIGGLTITPKRALTINFSTPYDFGETLALVNKKVAPGITTLEQLNSPSITFASRRGATTSATLAEQFPKAKVVLFDDENAIEQEFVSGNVQALAPTTPTPALIESRFPELTLVIHQPLFRSASGIGMRKGDVDALAYVNSWVAVNMENKWLPGRHKYWFDGRTWTNLVDGAK